MAPKLEEIAGSQCEESVQVIGTAKQGTTGGTRGRPQSEDSVCREPEGGQA